MIEVRGLSASYGKMPVLHDISLDILPGEILALVGINGCGKSTLLKSIAGLQPVSAGHITVNGTDISAMKLKERARHISYMSQSRNAPEIIAERLVLHGRFPYLSYPRTYTKKDREVVAAAMKKAGAEDLMYRRMTELSGGERQRVYIAMALAQDTDTILMDEPTNFLDIAHQIELFRLARQITDDGKAVVMVIHDLRLAMQMSDRIAVMDKGRLRMTGSPDEVFREGVIRSVFQVDLKEFKTTDGHQYYYG